MHFFATISKRTENVVLIQFRHTHIHKVTNYFLVHNICHLFHPSLLPPGTFSRPPAQNTSLISAHQRSWCKCPFFSRTCESLQQGHRTCQSFAKPFCSNSLVKDSPPKSPFSANFAPSSNIKRQAWKETYKCKQCDCLLANGETFDETHERDVPTALQMVTFTKVSKRKKQF